VLAAAIILLAGFFLFLEFNKPLLPLLVPLLILLRIFLLVRDSSGEHTHVIHESLDEFLVLVLGVTGKCEVTLAPYFGG
jgi:hypothetical protein